MSRRTFYEPDLGVATLSVHDLHCVLLLAGVNADPESITAWTELERVLAYDWAMRDHLAAADDSTVQRRPCPSFVTAADQT